MNEFLQVLHLVAIYATLSGLLFWNKSYNAAAIKATTTSKRKKGHNEFSKRRRFLNFYKIIYGQVTREPATLD